MVAANNGSVALARFAAALELCRHAVSRFL